MIRFFIVAFTLSAAILIYENFSMILPLNVNLIWKILLSALLLLAACKDFILRSLSGGSSFFPEIPRWLMIAGAIMYGFLIIALFMLIIKDAFWLIWKLCVILKILKINFPAAYASWLVMILSLVLSVYGTWEAVRVPDLNYHDVYIKGLSPEFEGLKIAVIVDVHASALNRREFIQNVVDKTNKAEPDLILMPGDFVDGAVSERKYDLEPLSNLKAKFGVFGTSGNHEYYSGYDEWFTQLEEFGINMLENENIILTSGDGKLIIAGIPDKQGANPGFGFDKPFPAPDLNKALENIPDDAKDAPIILMAHRPEAARKNAELGVALQVSGHTHGGQMPFMSQLIARFNNGYVRGWYNVNIKNINTMQLYVSPGTSQWGGFPVRILDPSEITLLTLYSN